MSICKTSQTSQISTFAVIHYKTYCLLKSKLNRNTAQTLICTCNLKTPRQCCSAHFMYVIYQLIVCTKPNVPLLEWLS